jgi:D-glycero-alpha-D-manno-heptose 1-phosphate guanylyltransferase
MTRLLVLAGGFGTRLRSICPDIPKPLVPVRGRPFLHYLNENWSRQGVDQIFFLLHYKVEMFTAFLNQQTQNGPLRECMVEVFSEPVPLGTGGAIAHAVKRFGIKGEFLVANADTWLGSGIRAVAASKVPSIGAIEVQDVGRYGSLQLSDGKVLGFDEKQVRCNRGWANAGLYHLESAFFSSWDGEPYSIERDLFPALASSGQLSAVTLDTDFIDIGVPEDYLRFCRWIESEKEWTL